MHQCTKITDKNVFVWQRSGLKQRIKPVLPCTLQSLHNKPQWRKFAVNRQYIFSEQPVSLQ